MDRISKRISQAFVSDSGEANGSVPDERRRQTLAAGSCATLSVLAGCVGFVPWGGPTETDEDEAAPPTRTDESTPEMSATETHVVGLYYDSGESAYEFSVTLKVPEGSDGRADWWQVETPTRERIARNTFAEPRRSRFTTSKTIQVPGDANVVVRGHDRKSGYGGQVMLANLETGKITLERQGHEAKSFEGYSF